jgi:MFS family permease
MQQPAGPQRWAVLGLGMIGLIAACAFQYGLPFLVPAFLADGLTLAQAGLLVSAPVFGLLCALVLWGAVTDRVGERWVLTAGLAGASAALVAAASVERLALVGGLLFVAGAASACVQVASGRLILSWFPVTERGLAMGLRQTGQPLGIGVAALVLPGLGARDPSAALYFLAAGCAGAAVLLAVGVRDVVREPASAGQAASPYRGDYLWRIHLAGAVLVIPQFTIGVFAFNYLVNDQGWSRTVAGPVLAGAQVGGAVGRLAVGWWSDRTGNRLGVMRVLCLGTSGVLLVLALGAASGTAIIVVAVVIASVLTVSTNGLSVTAVGERAGRSWAGRALGIHSTGQNAAAAVTPPAIAAVITGIGPVSGYPAAFAAVVVLPLIAAAVLPVAAERGY